MSVNTWIVGTTSTSDTSYANDYRYRSKICYGCGNGDVNTGCEVVYTIPNEQVRHDWAYAQQTLCSASVPIQWVSCLDYSICPNIGGIQAQAQWGYNNDSSSNPWTTGVNFTLNNSSRSSAKVDCVYPLAAFLSLNSVEEFANTFPEQVDDPDSAYNQQILPYFCLAQSNDCPKDPYTNLPMSACSRFVSLGKDGDLCRAWVDSLPNTSTESCGQYNASDKDLAYLNYCGHYNTPDCLCINRSDNPVYQVMSVGLSGTSNDRCWWTPCQDNTKYLIPTTLPCCDPAENTIICNNVNLVLGGNSENLSFNPTNFTSCGVEPGPVEDSIWNLYWWIIIVVLIVIVLAVALIIFLV